MFVKLVALLKTRGLKLDWAHAEQLPFRLHDEGNGVRIVRWDAAILGPQPSAEDIAAVSVEDAARALPRRIATRDILRRMTPAEHRALTNLANRDYDILKVWNILRAGGDADVNSAEWAQGLTLLKTRGIPSVWQDLATANARLAALTA